MNREKLLKHIRDNCQIGCVALPEDMQIEGNCSAIDETTDKTTEDWIKSQLASGNEWAWCVVQVRVEFDFLASDQYLGGCSYESKAKFIEPGGYYDDMVNEAIEDIANQILAINYKTGEILKVCQ